MSDPAQTITLAILSGKRSGETVSIKLPCEIGRATDAGCCLPDGHLSNAHGRFDLVDGAYRYTDRASSNGSVHVRDTVRTELNDDCLQAELWSGDLLLLGDRRDPVRVRVNLPDVPAGDVVAVRPIADVEQFADKVAKEPARLGVLYRYGVELGASTDLDRVLEVASKMIFELLPRATHLAVALKERAGRFPVVFAKDRLGNAVKIPVSRTIVKRVLDEKAGLLIANAATEFSAARSVVQSGVASVLSVPLWTGADIRGVLQVDNRDRPGLFAADDLEVLTVAAGHVSFAAENARLVARLRLAEQRLERENQYLKAKEQTECFSGIIGQSDGINRVVEAISKVRDTRVPVVIQGETGTGKELVARSLHYSSRRRDKLFVPQNCSTLPENLLESELFGHTRGAFTGADRDKKGLFELADGGTIFLDEIAEMPLILQAKLLRVLQEGEIWPLGASRPKRIDVRVVSATHRDLEKMVAEKTFREDLYYRLHVYPIHVPPLRDRPDDILPLARHFLTKYSKEFGRAATGFTPEAAECLRQYAWPGNVRELQNELQRVLIQRAEGDLILLEDLSARVRGQTGIVDDPAVPRGELKTMLIAIERVLLARALKANGNNKTKTAKQLGITREGLHKKLARFGM